MNKPLHSQTSWGWIIFWFIVFWPVGLIMLVKRQKTDKQATLKCNKGVFITAYILMGLGAIYFLMAITGQPDMFFAFLVFGGGGVVVFLFARRTKIKGDHYKKYIVMIVNSNQTSIDAIASAVGVTYNVAVTELQSMINNGYFKGAYIDVSQRRIMLPHLAQQQNFQTSATQAQVQPQSMVISCPGCGAYNRIIIGQYAACEYCDNVLQ